MNPREVLEQSAEAHGDLYRSVEAVEVSYDGEWTEFAKRVQPVLVDAGYRKASTEYYTPNPKRIVQEHKGPEGTKRVVRDEMSVSVFYDGVRNTEHDVNDAAALVADAYEVFLFGSSYLAVHGKELVYAGIEEENGVEYHLIQGALVPGLGFSKRDEFIAWIEVDSNRLHRFQFTLNGLESTQGADVSVEFSGYYSRHSIVGGSSLLPRHFIEYVERPIRAKAHEWEMEDYRTIRRR